MRTLILFLLLVTSADASVCGYATFTGSNGTALSSPYTTDIGQLQKHPNYSGSLNPVIFNNKLRASATGGSQTWYFKCPPESADDPAIATMTRLSGDGLIDVFVRMDPTTAWDGYAVRWNAGSWLLYRWTNGAASQIGSYTDAFNVGESRTIKLQATGTGATVNVKVYVDSVERINADDSTADRNVSAGRIGFDMYELDAASDATGFHLDSFQGGEGNTITPLPLVIIEGDSQVDPVAFTTLETDLISGLTTSVTSAQLATSGEKVTQMTTQVDTQVTPIVHNLLPKVVILLFAGTNDYYIDTASGATVVSRLETYADTVHALHPNLKLIVITVPYRAFAGGGGFDPDPPDINTRIAAGNTLTLANSNGKFDSIWDVQGALGTDPATYSNDNLHLTQDAADSIQPTGSAKIEALLGGGRSGFIGGGKSSPFNLGPFFYFDLKGKENEDFDETVRSYLDAVPLRSPHGRAVLE